MILQGISIVTKFFRMSGVCDTIVSLQLKWCLRRYALIKLNLFAPEEFHTGIKKARHIKLWTCLMSNSMSAAIRYDLLGTSRML